MKIELEYQIKKACPNVFRYMFDPKCRYDIRTGLSCDDGWYEIIRSASVKIEAIIQSVPEDQREHYWVSQIKEKCGTLRYYMQGHTDDIDKIIEEAEQLSRITCEMCGCKNRSVETKWIGGWIFTFCRTCRIKHIIRRFLRDLRWDVQYRYKEFLRALTAPFRKDK